MKPFERMPFNDTCVKAIEALLERAKQGKINFFAYSVTEGPLSGDNGFVGEMSSFYCGHYGLIHCAKRLMERMDQGVQVTRSLHGPANLWCYDLSNEPVSHDFIAWLATAKMIQRKEGNTDKTKICFLRNKNEDFTDHEYRAKFYESVMVPAVTLFDCEISPEAKEGRRLNCYTYREIVELAKQGLHAPRIIVPPKLLYDMRDNLSGIAPVTITLREHPHWEHRNSDLKEWLRFARYLQDRGEHVIFVRDYRMADEDIDGFETMPAASKDALVRSALYESAKCNFFVSNGPASFALFGSRPWIQFIDCREDEAYLQNRPDWWWLNHGMNRGDQFPWSTPQQRIVWAPDNYENMVGAWEGMFGERVNVAA